LDSNFTTPGGNLLDNSPPLNNKKAVLTRLGNMLLIVALLGATGAHWVMLQSVAWATMLADNARTESIQAALVKTFDGKHPCPICKQIAQGRQSEKKSDQQSNLKRFEFVNQRAVLVVDSPDYFLLPCAGDATATLLAHAPPVPPPRKLVG
jgi:hypothetical protein